MILPEQTESAEKTTSKIKKMTEIYGCLESHTRFLCNIGDSIHHWPIALECLTDFPTKQELQSLEVAFSALKSPI